MVFKDQLVRCGACGKSFVYTVREQRSRADRGLSTEAPAFCPECRGADVRLAEAAGAAAPESEAPIEGGAGGRYEADRADRPPSFDRPPRPEHRDRPYQRGDRSDRPPAGDRPFDRRDRPADRGDRPREGGDRQGHFGRPDQRGGGRGPSAGGRPGEGVARPGGRGDSGDRGFRGDRGPGGRGRGGPRRDGGGRPGQGHGRGGPRGGRRDDAPRQTELRIRYLGTVKWFDRERGFGFIAQDEGGELFVHMTGVIAGAVEGVLYEGQPVEFEIERTPRGMQAVDVVALA